MIARPGWRTMNGRFMIARWLCKWITIRPFRLPGHLLRGHLLQEHLLRRHLPWVFCVLVAVMLAGCSQGAEDQPKIEPLEPSRFFEDYQSARPIADHAVPRQATAEPEWFYTGEQNGGLVETVPISITEAVLVRGQERYNIYCSPCHGLAGYGEGMVVQRGFPAPPSFHEEYLRRAPAGHFFHVITDGYGHMFSYAARVKPGDRWAIIAYIRALQFSQHATAEQVAEVDQERLETLPGDRSELVATLAASTPSVTPAPAATATPTTMATREAVTAGQELFQNLGCVDCHQQDDDGVAPSLVGVFGSPVDLQSGETVTADEEYIRRSILNPSAQIVAGYTSVMPSFEGRIDERELAQLVEYIKSLQPEQ